MIFASTFLSHSNSDKPFVQEVARELVRRGVIVWLDVDQATLGADLTRTLPEAIGEQATVTLFLSQNTVKARWFQEELETAVSLYDDAATRGRLLPIFLDDPVPLVQSHPLLRTRWMHRDGRKLSCIYHDARKDGALNASETADQVARATYRSLKFPEQREVVVYLDQRGRDRRIGIPKDIPKNVSETNLLGLVVRPDSGTRQERETLTGAEFDAFRCTIEWALAEALGGVRWADSKRIHILGNAQLGLSFYLGHYFNRSTLTYLYGHNRDAVFDNDRQPAHTALEGGNPDCETLDDRIAPIQPGEFFDSLALVLSTDRYLHAVLEYLRAQPNPPCIKWIRSGRFETSQQAMEYIADVVALLIRLKERHHVKTVYLYCGLPFAMVPLLAANMRYVVPKLVFMEYRSDLQDTDTPASDMYVALPPA